MGGSGGERSVAVGAVVSVSTRGVEEASLAVRSMDGSCVSGNSSPDSPSGFKPSRSLNAGD